MTNTNHKQTWLISKDALDNCKTEDEYVLIQNALSQHKDPTSIWPSIAGDNNGFNNRAKDIKDSFDTDTQHQWFRFETHLPIELEPNVMTIRHNHTIIEYYYQDDDEIRGAFWRLTLNQIKWQSKPQNNKVMEYVHADSTYKNVYVGPCEIQFSAMNPKTVRVVYSDNNKVTTREHLKRLYEVTHLLDDANIPLLLTDEADATNIEFWENWINEEFEGPKRMVSQLVKDIKQIIGWTDR